MSDGYYRVVPFSGFGLEQTQLALGASLPEMAGGVGYDVPLAVSITNSSPWAARDTVLEVDLSPGLVMSPGQPGEGSTHATLQLGTLVDGTNLTFQLRTTTTGSQRVRVSVQSLVPDADPADNVRQLAIAVPDVPMLFMDDDVVWEGGYNYGAVLRVWLSRPAPGTIEVPFQIIPRTTQASDFLGLTGAFLFYEGQQHGEAHLVQGDATPELDETAEIQLTPIASVGLLRTNATLTLMNDDLPQVTFGTSTVREGSAGQTNGVAWVNLSSPSPYPVDVWLRTGPGTAQVGTDYLSREGWVSFPPGSTAQTFIVPVLGDSVFEPHETVLLNFVRVVGGLLGTTNGVLTIQNDDAPPQPSLSISVPANGQVSFEFSTVLGATYHLQVRTNVLQGGWWTVVTPIRGDGQPVRLQMQLPVENENFYRLRAQ